MTFSLWAPIAKKACDYYGCCQETGISTFILGKPFAFNQHEFEIIVYFIIAMLMSIILNSKGEDFTIIFYCFLQIISRNIIEFMRLDGAWRVGFFSVLQIVLYVNILLILITFRFRLRRFESVKMLGAKLQPVGCAYSDDV